MDDDKDKPKTEEQQECPPKDFQRIVHELQVYQIELQMQNEELRNARQEVQEVLNKYTELYDFAPVSYFTLDKNSLIVEANLAGARMLNLQRGQLIGRRFDLLVSPDFRQEFNSYCKTLFEVDTIQICSEVKITADDKAIIYAQIEGIALQNRDLIQIALMNITERKKAEETLRLSEERFRSIFDSVNDAIFVHDLSTGTILDVNRSMCEQSGYTLEEALQLKVEDISSGEPPYRQKEALEWMEKASAGGPQLFEWHCKRKDGSLFWGEVNMRRGNIWREERLLVTVRDITKRKLAKEALIKAYDELDDIVKVRTETLFNLNGDLKMQSQSLEEVNTALNVLLRQREQDKKEQEDRILSNVRELIVPCIEQLKKSGLSPKYESCLSVLESNLLEIISPFSITLSSKYTGLTHTEIRVADFIKEGKSTKEIAEIFNIAKDTVDAHRKNIRKKLGLKNTKTNLRSYLLSIK